MKYATVHKERKDGRVVNVTTRVIFGTLAAVLAAPGGLPGEQSGEHGIRRAAQRQRDRNGRKVRKTCCFSKDWLVHEAVTYFTMYTSNFCWPVRTLRVKGPNGIISANGTGRRLPSGAKRESKDQLHNRAR